MSKLNAAEEERLRLCIDSTLDHAIAASLEIEWVDVAQFIVQIYQHVQGENGSRFTCKGDPICHQVEAER